MSYKLTLTLCLLLFTSVACQRTVQPQVDKNTTSTLGNALETTSAEAQEAQEAWLPMLISEYLQDDDGTPIPQMCGDNTLTITGSQYIFTQTDVNALTYVNKIEGSLILKPMSNLDFSPLSLLTEVTGNFDLYDTWDRTQNQTSLIGFDCLTTIGQDFYIRVNRLTNISGFSALETIGRDFFVHSNYTLQNISGFSALKIIGRDFFVTYNEALQNISGFSALETINEDFIVTSNSDLTSISGFSALETINNSFAVGSNGNLTNISGFSALKSVGGSFSISINNILTNIINFSLLSTNIAGISEVSSNPMLNCQNPIPSFSPVDVSQDNLVNCP